MVVLLNSLQECTTVLGFSSNTVDKNPQQKGKADPAPRTQIYRLLHRNYSFRYRLGFLVEAPAAHRWSFFSQNPNKKERLTLLLGLFNTNPLLPMLCTFVNQVLREERPSMSRRSLYQKGSAFPFCWGFLSTVFELKPRTVVHSCREFNSLENNELASCRAINVFDNAKQYSLILDHNFDFKLPIVRDGRIILKWRDNRHTFEFVKNCEFTQPIGLLVECHRSFPENDTTFPASDLFDMRTNSSV
jgi:hypothetical protein